jgi:hypothetical protein
MMNNTEHPHPMGESHHSHGQTPYWRRAHHDWRFWGPYSVVHGPVTALQAARAAAHLRTAIVQGAFNSLGNCLISPLVVLSWMSLPAAEFQLISLPEHNTILRC